MAQNCSNCYNGCAEIVSDRCVMYTGVDVPVLGVLKGDSLSYVEQALISFLTSMIDGSGMKLVIADDLYCDLVTQYLQECSTVTALDLFKALVQAACNIQEQIDAINVTLTALNADYDVDCLEDVTDSSDTHDVLQAVITKLCEVDADLTALALDVSTNYVRTSELNALIDSHIASTSTGTNFSSRMVPYSILPYYGSLSFFDATGAGTGEWENIYLCNGLNGTPDIRGRVVVGAIVAVPGGALDAEVNPASSSFSPNYALGTKDGDNSITLTTPQIPVHTHTTASAGNHIHTVTALATAAAGSGGLVGGGIDTANDGTAITNIAGAHTHTLTDTGSGEAHDNKQPAIATYFIMYIP